MTPGRATPKPPARPSPAPRCARCSRPREVVRGCGSPASLRGWIENRHPFLARCGGLLQIRRDEPEFLPVCDPLMEPLGGRDMHRVGPSNLEPRSQNRGGCDHVTRPNHSKAGTLLKVRPKLREGTLQGCMADPTPSA